MALKVFLKNSNDVNDDLLAVNIKITENKQNAFVPLGFKIDAKDFNLAESKIKNSNTDFKALNEKIELALNKLKNIKESLLESNVKISAKVLKRIFTKDTDNNFVVYINNFIKDLRDKGNYGTYINYRSSVKKFNAFVNKNYLDFTEVNDELIRSFEDYLRNKLNNSTNTVYNNIKVLRKVVYGAIENGLINASDNPFNKYKLEKEDKHKAFLQFAEIEKLESFDVSKNKPLTNIKFMFLFSCFSGLKLNVVKTLKWKDVIDGNVAYKHLGITYNVKLINKAVKVLNEYKQFFENIEREELIFQNYSNVYINKSLKRLATEVDINKNLTFNMARNTFAILSIKKGVRLDVVAQLLGHKNFYSILPYVNSTTSNIDVAYNVLNTEFS